MSELLQLALIAAMVASTVAVPLFPYWLYLKHQERKHSREIERRMKALRADVQRRTLQETGWDMTRFIEHLEKRHR